MFPKALNPQNTNTLRSRCEYRTASGRQCRTPFAPGHTNLCPRHAAAQRDDSTDVLALLSSDLPEKKSAADIHAHLWNLSLALQQGRISPRRAAVSPTSTACFSAPSPPSTSTPNPQIAESSSTSSGRNTTTSASRTGGSRFGRRGQSWRLKNHCNLFPEQPLAPFPTGRRCARVDRSSPFT